MAPRGRGRSRKQFGESRMGAAWDAMRPFGFPQYMVVKTVKELLEVYGGEEGWPFIEEYSYKVLLEAILEKVEAKEKKKNEAGASASNTLAIEAPTGTTGLISGSEAEHGTDEMQLAEVPDTTPTQRHNALMITSPQSRCTGSNRGWLSEVQLTRPDPLDDTNSAQTTSTAAINSPPPGFPTKQTRSPCHGWMTSEDVHLPQPQVPKPQKSNAEFNSLPPGFTDAKLMRIPCRGWISEDVELPEPEVPKAQTSNAEFNSPPPGFTTKNMHSPSGGWFSEEVKLPEPDVVDTNTAKTRNAVINSPPPGFSDAKKTRSPCGGLIKEEVKLPEPKVLDTTAAKTSNAGVNSPPPGFSNVKRTRRPYHGWISEDWEEDLIELKPGPLAEKVAKLLLERRSPKRKRWDVKPDKDK